MELLEEDPVRPLSVNVQASLDIDEADEKPSTISGSFTTERMQASVSLGQICILEEVGVTTLWFGTERESLLADAGTSLEILVVIIVNTSKSDLDKRTNQNRDVLIGWEIANVFMEYMHWNKW